MAALREQYSARHSGGQPWRDDGRCSMPQSHDDVSVPKGKTAGGATATHQARSLAFRRAGGQVAFVVV
eukprot:2916176-Prymnesium_polylepis.2